MHRKFLSLLVLTVCISLVACEEAPTPVATLSVAPAQVGLPFPHYQTVEIEIGMLETTVAGDSPWVMLHLLDLTGSVVRTFDHALSGEWTPGQSRSYSIDLYQSALAPPLDPGVYQLTGGLFDSTAGRWALAVDGEQVHRLEYALGTVEVLQGSKSAPKFLFSPAWMATEAGTDVQVLARRWLRSEGAIRLGDLTSAGTVRLDLRIEPPDPQLEDLILDEGFDEVQLDVATTCGEETWSLRGVGTHVLEVAVAPPAGDETSDGCEISLTPHYRVVTRRNLNSRALALDLLAWRPQSP